MIHEDDMDGMSAANLETLSSIDFFSSLSLAERKVLAKRCKYRHYVADQPIICYHEHTRDVFFVIKGRLQVTLYAISGKEVLFQTLDTGQMFGELSAIDGEPRSAAVTTLKETWLAFMTPEDFWYALRTYPVLTEVLLKQLSKLIRSLSTRVFEFSTLLVRDRLHIELLRLAETHRQGANTAVISPAPTHWEIASRIGTHREAVTRAIRSLKNNGLIERGEGKLIIKDVAQLKQLVKQILGE